MADAVVYSVLHTVGLSYLDDYLLGAVQGAMCCPDGRNAFRNDLAALERGDVPLASWLIGPLAICVVLFVLAVVGRRRLPHAVEVD